VQTGSGSTRSTIGATACLSALALFITAPGLVGRTALGPESLLDSDPLYRTGAAAALPWLNDYTPIAADLPRDLEVARQLRAGSVPKWNPLVGCGTPLWAEQGGPFFPLKLPFYALPSGLTYDLFKILRLVLAGLGAYLLARCRGLAFGSALAAGATFELCGSVVEAFPYAASSPLAVLPLVLLGGEAIARRRSAPAAAGAALALGVAGHGGHPTQVAMIFAAFAAGVIGHGLARWRTPRAALGIAAWGGVAGILGLGLAAPVLLPLAELAEHGRSYKQMALGEIIRASAIGHSRNTLPLALFAPDVLQSLRASIGTPSAGAAMLGVVTLTLAVAGAIGGGLSAALCMVMVLGIVIAAAPPGLRWLADLTALRVILPNYAWVLVTLPLTQAAGAGVAALSSPGGVRRAAVALGMILVGSSSLLLVSDPQTFFEPFVASLFRNAIATWPGLLRLVVPPLVVAIALAVCVAARHTPLRHRYGMLFAALAVSEQLVLWSSFLHQPRSSVLAAADPPAVTFLRDRLVGSDWRFIGVPFHVGFPMTPLLFDLPDVRSVSALPIRRYVEYLETIDPRASEMTIQHLSRTRSPLLDRAAARYIAVPRAGDAPPAAALDQDPRAPLAYAGDHVAIYDNRAALPRARIVHRATYAADQAASRALLGSRSQRGESAADAVVILEPDETGNPPPALSGPPSPRDAARIVDQTHPDRLIVETSSEQPGFLIVADTYYPGWTAAIDGVPSPIYPADLMFRAVFVPAGRHVVAWHYQPRSFALGLVACALSLCACVVFALWPRLRARTTTHPPSTAPLGTMQPGKLFAKSADDLNAPRIKPQDTASPTPAAGGKDGTVKEFLRRLATGDVIG
jgi:hypothetical protein